MYPGVTLAARFYGGVTVVESSDFRNARMRLNHGAGRMPVLVFGTLIPDAAATISYTRDALAAGFRHSDCAERYGNEREVGEALQVGLTAGGITREDLFVTAWRRFTDHTQDRGPRAGEFNITALPEDAFDEINRFGRDKDSMTS